jgi:hypothetical protein
VEDLVVSWGIMAQVNDRGCMSCDGAITHRTVLFTCIKESASLPDEFVDADAQTLPTDIYSRFDR